MKKVLPIAALMAVFLALGFLWVSTFDKIEAAQNDMKEKIGSKVILESDTLIIVDYSLLNENYTLSNGQTVSVDFIKKTPIIK